MHRNLEKVIAETGRNAVVLNIGVDQAKPAYEHAGGAWTRVNAHLHNTKHAMGTSGTPQP